MAELVQQEFDLVEENLEVAAHELCDDCVSDDATPDETAADDVAPESPFRELGLDEALVRTVEAAGYHTPTPIQAETIPHLLAGRDVLGQAQTGTGKTAAFALPMLQRINLAVRRPQVLVLAPTRELAIQVAEAFEKYAAEMRGLRVAAVYGGQEYPTQLRALDRGPQVIVGTPGRVMDHMRRGSLVVDGLKMIVLDEADEMLRMGFAEDVEWVLTQVPAERQIALFSATLPAPIRRIAQTHLHEPVEITIRQETATADTIHQRFVIVAPNQKEAALARILEAEPIDGVIIFVKTRSTTEPLAEFLNQRGHRAAALNGDIAQKQRERIVESLRAGKINILVATDVAARGLDVQRISHVINYDLPFDSEVYVHRIGRTGRAGRSGEAILFVHPRDRRLLKNLERATRQPIEPMDLPSNRTINKQRVARFHEKITAALAHPLVEQFASIIEQYRREKDVPAEQIAAALAVLAGGEQPLLLKEVLQTAEFIDRSQGPRSGRHDRDNAHDRRGDRAGDFRPDRHGAPRNFSEPVETFRVEVGHANGVLPGNLVGAIANEAGLAGARIGRIEIFDHHSTIDLPVGMPDDLFYALKKVRVVGRKLNISRPHELRESTPAPEAPGAKKPKKNKKSKRKEAAGSV